MGVLDKDTDLRFPSYLLLNASAGSGKTTQLTLRILQLLLSDRVPHNTLRSLLATTFTNNAAKEMKARTLERLRRAALGDAVELEKLREVLDAPAEEIGRRAAARVEEILRDYSDFQIRTIDSFLVSLFRAAAVELGYDPASEIRLSRGWTLERAFQRMARELREGSPAAERLRGMVDLIEADREASASFAWDPYEELQRTVTRIRRTLAAASADPPGNAGADRRPELREALRAAAGELLEALRAAGAEIKVLAEKRLQAALAGDADEAVRLRLPDPAFKRPGKKADRERLAPREPDIQALSRRFSELADSYLREAVLHHYDPYLEVLRSLDPWLERVRRGGGVLSIDDVAEVLAARMDPALIPDIYLTLGERLWHHLIDEFQDTSPVQWRSLAPLLENALAADGSLFVVGDPKQSIYSFRGADWTIMTREMQGGSFPSAPAVVRPLETNFRSKGELVRFVAEVFDRVVPGTDYADALPLSGLDRVVQKVEAKAEDAGYVRVGLFQRGEEGEEPVLEKAVGTVQECLARGHRPSAIAILAPGNDAVIAAGGWLNRAGIPVLSHSNLDIRRRKATGEVLALLKFLDAPIDDLAFATVLTGTLFARRIAGTPHAGTDVHGFLLEAAEEPGAALAVRFRRQFPGLWKELFDGLVRVVGTMPLYDMVNRVLHAFDVYSTMQGEEATLTRFLQAVVRCEAEGEAGIKDLLRAAEEEEEGWDLDAPKRSEAVSVMTIHKAKGLGFPVVIILLDDRKPKTPTMLASRSGAGVRLLHAKAELEDRVADVREAREERIRRDRADELNRLYVALTRAEDEMYIYGAYADVPGVPTKFIPWEPAERGKPGAPRGAARDEAPPASIVHITEEVQPPASPPRAAAYAEMLRGDFIHGMLARVQGADDPRLDAIAAETAAVLGLGAPPEGAADRVASFLALPAVAEVFAPREGGRVLVEQDLVDADGRLLRADRIVVDRDMVMVVDFKTGGDEFEEEYRRQVRAYMRLAADVFPGRRVTGRIAYVDRRVVVTVA